MCLPKGRLPTKIVCRFLAGPFAGTSDDGDGDDDSSASAVSELSPLLISLKNRTVDCTTAGCV